MKKEIKILSWFYSFFITSNKLDFSLFIFTALIVSIIEVMSIASIIPFLEVVLSENMANDNKFVFLITEYFKFQTREELVVFLITIFLSLLFLSSLKKILIVIFVNHIQRKVGS